MSYNCVRTSPSRLEPTRQRCVAIVMRQASLPTELWRRLISVFGSIFYSRSQVYIHQNLVVVHVIFIDQWNQTTPLYEIQVTVIYCCAILVTVTSECHAKRVLCKTLTGTLANSADPNQTPQSAASDQGLHCLLILQEVKERNETALSPFRTIFQTYTGRQSTHLVQPTLWDNLPTSAVQPTLWDNRPTSAVNALSKRIFKRVCYFLTPFLLHKVITRQNI